MARAAGCSRITNDDVESKGPSRTMFRNTPVSIRRVNAADHAALGGTGLLTKPWLRISNMFGPTERSSALIGSFDPRSVIELELVH
jgi:hypothetical protein